MINVSNFRVTTKGTVINSTLPSDMSDVEIALDDLLYCIVTTLLKRTILRTVTTTTVIIGFSNMTNNVLLQKFYVELTHHI